MFSGCIQIASQANDRAIINTPRNCLLLLDQRSRTLGSPSVSTGLKNVCLTDQHHLIPSPGPPHRAMPFPGFGSRNYLSCILWSRLHPGFIYFRPSLLRRTVLGQHFLPFAVILDLRHHVVVPNANYQSPGNGSLSPLLMDPWWLLLLLVRIGRLLSSWLMLRYVKIPACDWYRSIGSEFMHNN